MITDELSDRMADSCILNDDDFEMRSRGIDPARGSGPEFIERMLSGRQFHGNAAMPGELGANRG